MVLGADYSPSPFPVWKVVDKGSLHSLVIWSGPYHDYDWDPILPMQHVWVYEVEACEGDTGEKDRDGLPSSE